MASCINEITDEQSLLARYLRAESIEHEICNQSMVLNTQITPHWIGDSNSFWYARRVHKEGGNSADISTEYCLVNAETVTHREAFNHSLLAQALTRAAGELVSPDNLPISNLQLELAPESVSFIAFNKHWKFDAAKETCEVITLDVTADTNPIPSGWLRSPDGKKAAFSRDYNLWIRDLDSGEERALTQNGECHYAYAVEPQARDLTKDVTDADTHIALPLEALWSPDSTRLFTFQLDERRVRSIPSMVYVPQDGTVAPRVIERKNALPGDEHVAQYRMLVIDVATAKETAANYPALEDSLLWLTPFSGNRAWWAGDSTRAYFVDVTRGQKTARLMAFDTQDGAVQCLFEESSDTYLELGLEFEHPSMLTMLRYR